METKSANTTRGHLTYNQQELYELHSKYIIDDQESLSINSDPNRKSTKTPTVPNLTTITKETLRKGFIRKVLFILMIQLAIATLFIGLTFAKEIGLKDFMLDNPKLIWIALAISFATIIVLACYRNILKKIPFNYILLFVFTCSFSYFLGAIAAATDSKIVLFAGGFTVGITLAISAYACLTKTDLTRKGYVLSGLATVILMMVILSIVFRSNFLNVVYSGLIGAFFLLLLAYNIQRLVGRYENQYSLDDYIVAALDLYIEIAQIFLVIVGLSKSSRN